MLNYSNCQHEPSEADPELFNVLSLKVGENVTERSLQYVKEVWDSLARRLQIPHSALLFEKVADGCIEIIWKFPSHLTTFIVRRAQENTNYFREQQVSRSSSKSWSLISPRLMNPTISTGALRTGSTYFELKFLSHTISLQMNVLERCLYRSEGPSVWIHMASCLTMPTDHVRLHHLTEFVHCGYL